MYHQPTQFFVLMWLWCCKIMAHKVQLFPWYRNNMAHVVGGANHLPTVTLRLILLVQSTFLPPYFQMLICLNFHLLVSYLVHTIMNRYIPRQTRATSRWNEFSQAPNNDHFIFPIIPCYKETQKLCQQHCVFRFNPYQVQSLAKSFLHLPKQHNLLKCACLLAYWWKYEGGLLEMVWSR